MEITKSSFATLGGHEGSEQILLAVRGGIRWPYLPSWNRPKGTHQTQGLPVALKNGLQFQTAGTTTLDGAGPTGFRIKHGMARTLAMPSRSFNFEHFYAIITPFWHKSRLAFSVSHERGLPGVRGGHNIESRKDRSARGFLLPLSAGMVERLTNLGCTRKHNYMCYSS